MPYKLSRKIAFFFASRGAISAAEMEVYEYALQRIFSTSIMLLCSIIIGIFFDTVFGIIVFSISFLSLRHHTGGLHFENPLVCFLFSQALVIANSVVIRYFDISFRTMLLLLEVAIVLILLFAPVNHPNFDVDAETLAAKKKKAVIIVAIQILAFALFSNFPAISYGIVLGVLNTAILVAVSKIIKQEVEK